LGSEFTKRKKFFFHFEYWLLQGLTKQNRRIENLILEGRICSFIGNEPWVIDLAVRRAICKWLSEYIMYPKKNILFGNNRDTIRRKSPRLTGLSGFFRTHKKLTRNVFDKSYYMIHILYDKIARLRETTRAILSVW